MLNFDRCSRRISCGFNLKHYQFPAKKMLNSKRRTKHQLIQPTKLSAPVTVGVP